ncbi:NUDIX domain-containing protein [Streptomyces sp. BH-SS-21]|uniref:NUDIX domain-containing protein n=1 Tax=Streptomyces liliiviolaceus TaxID=2823109 RepID=A0A940Y4F0_9ACTN|nr:NUDIX domain-containing protein [Streptomyces liliiviolaceus]MBQ0855421.1 NUDIX domain-containing protein [Streptomyces liliiviolaceus]
MTTATADLDVHVILRQGSEILLALRAGDIYGSGQWAAPCGKVHPGETLAEAAVREATEELGITIDAGDLAVAQTVHMRHGATDHLGVFFEARTWQGALRNREPDKCAAVRWFPLTGLPHPVMDYSAAGIHGYLTAPGALSSYNDAREARTIRPAAGTPAGHDAHD